MSLILKALRRALGQMVIAVDYLTRPKKIQRPAAEQALAEAAAKRLALYQFYACPFCVKTRRTIRRLNVPVEYRDAQSDPVHRRTLAAEGGKIQVPCLRIDADDGTTWMYESGAIIEYLNRRFDPVHAMATESVR